MLGFRKQWISFCGTVPSVCSSFLRSASAKTNYTYNGTYRGPQAELHVNSLPRKSSLWEEEGG